MTVYLAKIEKLESKPQEPVDAADKLGGFAEWLGASVDSLSPEELLEKLEQFLKEKIEGKAAAASRLPRGGMNRLVDVTVELAKSKAFRAASFSKRSEIAARALQRLRSGS